MTPEIRKEASELRLHKRGIRINLQLPVIESEDEIVLRPALQVWQRMQALYQVWQVLEGDLNRSQVQSSGIAAAASFAERQFLLSAEYPRSSDISDVGEALYFMLWASAQQAQINIPGQAIAASQLRSQMQALEAATDPVGQLQLRRKAELLDWSDLLYRLHWAVRHAQISGREIPGRLYVPAIQQWHKAVNWLCCYDEQDDWDNVSTETGGAAVE